MKIAKAKPIHIICFNFFFLAAVDAGLLFRLFENKIPLKIDVVWTGKEQSWTSTAAAAAHQAEV